MKIASNRPHVLMATLACLLSSIFSACGGKSSMCDPPTTGAPSANVVPASKHVLLVMEENQAYATVAGNPAAWPHLNAMISKGALATNYYADVHPSIGNYFMLT